MPTTDLPLSPDLLGDARVTVYRALAATGHLPSSDRLAAVTGSLERAAVAIARLAEQRA